MIHPSAIIHPGARIGEGVEVGPFSVIGEGVEIGARTWIGSHVVITGLTRIGEDNRIYPFCSLGERPQDMKYAGEPTRLEIGDRNSIREYCNFNTGTVQDAGVTRIGSDNWIMASVHVGHDCHLGDRTILANNVTLGGHVHIGDWVILGGMTAVHQFTRVGAHSMCGGGTILVQDLPPFVMANGSPASVHGINSEGLRRRGYSAPAISAIKRAYKTLYRKGLTLDEARREIESIGTEHPELLPLIEFLANPGRGIVR